MAPGQAVCSNEQLGMLADVFRQRFQFINF